MRLLLNEIDNRLAVTLDKSMRREGVNGMMTYGSNNDYPQIIERLINGSQSAKTTSQIYAKFLSGNGFVDARLNDIVVGKNDRGANITMYDLLRHVSSSISKFNGFYIHVNVNLGGKVKNAYLKDFKTIRYAKPDDTGYSAMLLQSDNWNEKGKRKNVKEYNVFNLNEDVIISQVKKAGGIEKYKGQIYAKFIDEDYFYPLSPFDSVYLDLDTEAQIALYKNRQIRDGFLDKIVFRVAPQPPEFDDSGRQINEGNEELANTIRSFVGADGESVLILEDDFSADGEIEANGNFRIDRIQSNVNDKLFENWEKAIANSIRKAAKGVPAILIDYEQSNLGNTSGEAVRAATQYYNALTQLERDIISDSLYEIFSNSDNAELASLPRSAYGIDTLNLADYGTNNNNTTATN